MTLRQLEYLIEVGEQGSISVAARKLMISQPSLSQCIKGIEEEKGFSWSKLTKIIKLNGLYKAMMK